jgi:GH24 family phage-related lysozyme (muramidase)
MESEIKFKGVKKREGRMTGQKKLLDAFVKHVQTDPSIEWLCYNLYLDSLGFLTIGYGHLISKLEWEDHIWKSSEKLIYELSQKQLADIEAYELSNEDKSRCLKNLKSAVETLQELPFRAKTPTDREYDIAGKEKNEAIEKAFIELLTKSLILRAKLKRDPRTKALIASKYRTETNNLFLPELECAKLLEKDVAEKIGHLNSSFPEFEQYPFTAQIALLDMSYNMGVGRLKASFPTLTALVKAQNWRKIVDDKEYCR